MAESRRLAFNIWVGLAGIITWFTVLIAGSAADKPGVDFEEPFAIDLGATTLRDHGEYLLHSGIDY